MIDLADQWEGAEYDGYRVVPVSVEQFLATVGIVGVENCFGHSGLEAAGFETLVVTTEAKVISITSRPGSAQLINYILVTMPGITGDN